MPEVVGDWSWILEIARVACFGENMSAALLRKGLELLGSDSSGVKKRPGGNNRQAALSSHKTGMKKRHKRLKQQGTPQNQRASAKNRVIKSAVEEYKKQTAQDYLVQNLKYMLGSQAVANKVSCGKILTQHFGRKAKDQRVKKEKKMVEKSVFTDQDFKKFQKEYFGTR